jgi:hypothetical protein
MPGPEGYMKEFDRLMGRVEERASLSESLTTREKKRPRRYCERCSRKGRRLNLAEARATRIVKSWRAHKKEPLDF